MNLTMSIRNKVLLSLFFFGTHLSIASADEAPRPQRHLKQQDPCEILIRLVDTGGDRPDEEHIDCQMSPADGGEILEFDNLPPGWLKTNKKNLRSGQMELFVSGTELQGDKLHLPQNVNPELKQKAKKIIKSRLKNKRKRGKNEEKSSRTLARTVDDDKRVLVVRVIGDDLAETTSTKEDLADSIFGIDGDTVNLKSQMADCSKDQLIIKPAEGSGVSNGVIDVKIPINVRGTSETTVHNAVIQALPSFLPDCQSVPCGYDHIMLCLPPGTSGSWIAYAYLDNHLSVYNDDWCTYLSTQMHEIGHNLNLGHSTEGTQEYGDGSGMMGYSQPVDDGPKMCFNGAKSWDLGWYSEGHVSVEHSQSWEGTLTSIADYNLSNPQTTLVQVTHNNDKYYIMYNRKIGINSGTQEGANQVLITKKTGTRSSLVAKLGQNEMYFPFQGFMVKTGTIDNASGEAIVLVNTCHSDTDCHDGDPCTTDTCVFNQCSHILNNECTYWDATVRVTTDNYPAETSWTLVNECTGITELSGGSMTRLNTEYTESGEIPLGRYKFTINDQYADGICCQFGQGSYSVTLGSQTIASGAEFSSSAVHTYGTCARAPPLPAVTPAPITSSPTPAPITPAPTPSPITPAPTSSPITPAPIPAPTTSSPTPAPITPNPTLSPITPNPTPAPNTSSPTPRPSTLAPVPAPITPNPTLSPITPVPTPAPATPNPTPAPTTLAPVSAPTTSSPTPAPITPNPTLSPITPNPTPVPTTSSPTPSPITPNPTPAPTTSSPTPSPITSAPIASIPASPAYITRDTFDNGGGRSSYKFAGEAKVDNKKSRSGSYSAKLKKGGYIEHKTSHSVSGYAQLEVSFSFINKFKNNSDKLVVQAITNLGTRTLATYSKREYRKDAWYRKTIAIDPNEFSTLKLKFVANNKDVFIDDVNLIGKY